MAGCGSPLSVWLWGPEERDSVISCSSETEVPFGRLWFPSFGLAVRSGRAGLFRFLWVAKRNGGGGFDSYPLPVLPITVLIPQNRYTHKSSVHPKTGLARKNELPTLHSVWPPPQPENHKPLRNPLKKRQHHAFSGQTEPRTRKSRASRKSGGARKGKA